MRKHEREGMIWCDEKEEEEERARYTPFCLRIWLYEKKDGWTTFLSKPLSYISESFTMMMINFHSTLIVL